MSELINRSDNRATIRWKLLTSASALALTVYVSSANISKAEDADHPQVWIELGGQMEGVSGQGEVFTPAFLAANSDSSVLQRVSPLQAQKPPLFNFGEEGKISIEPENSSWVFSAAIRYGRSSSRHEVQHQTSKIIHPKYNNNIPSGIQTVENFADTQVHNQESHAVMDFSAGKDVGLGLFGKDSTSTLSFGVRFAQFTSEASVDIRARPDLRLNYLPSAHATPLRLVIPYFHTYHATGEASRSFHGMGPSISWTGSTPFAGNVTEGEFSFDWGANAAILFGKQKARVRHQESGNYVTRYDLNRLYYSHYQNPVGGHNNVRSITVPNVGGSIGLSWRVQDFKVSFGYRADFFFGAIDGGIDTPKNETLGFMGPFATVSVGLGG